MRLREMRLRASAAATFDASPTAVFQGRFDFLPFALDSSTPIDTSKLTAFLIAPLAPKSPGIAVFWALDAVFPVFLRVQKPPKNALVITQGRFFGFLPCVSNNDGQNRPFFGHLLVITQGRFVVILRHVSNNAT